MSETDNSCLSWGATTKINHIDSPYVNIEKLEITTEIIVLMYLTSFCVLRRAEVRVVRRSQLSNFALPKCFFWFISGEDCMFQFPSLQ